MISPRRTRLLRVPDLKTFQLVIARTACRADVWRARACAVIVPTRAAGEQLRRTLEGFLLTRVLGPAPAAAATSESSSRGAAARGGGAPRALINARGPGSGDATALVLPDLLTRDDWYARLHDVVPGPPPRLLPLEREVLVRMAAEEAVRGGAEPPFKLRPGLIHEMVAFYDELRRHQRSIDAFERLTIEDLEPSAGFDRGAERLLRQTRFLAAAFRAYEEKVRAAGACDEHGLRDWLIAHAVPTPFRQVVVTVADRAADPAGLWPADFDLLARLPGLEEIDIVATDALLETGLQQRLHHLMPGIEEVRPTDIGRRDPTLLVPEAIEAVSHFTCRDREEELRLVLRHLKSRGPASDEHLGVVLQRPLPYLYLAKHLCESSGVPFDALDALPLAAEPFAAALDLVFSFVTSGHSRSSTMGLLRCPHFVFDVEGRRLDPRAVEALDVAWSEAAGDRDPRRVLDAIAAADAPAPSSHSGGRRRGLARPAAAAALGAIDELTPLRGPGSAVARLDALVAFVARHATPRGEIPSIEAREARARAAILGAIEQLRDACARHGEGTMELADLVSTIKRWIERQTFAPRAGSGGVRLVDAEAARYGSFDELRLVGLVEGEWPERVRGSIFYPASLLSQLGWSHDGDRSTAARARFCDLLHLPSRRIAVSTFTLEDDAVVGPSTLLEDVHDSGLVREVVRLDPRIRIAVDEALSLAPLVASAVTGEASEWLRLRVDRPPRDLPGFHGAAGARPPTVYAVRAIEQYLQCPFKYFASAVLVLKEEREDEPTLDARARGRFLHDVLEACFARWHEGGHGAIDERNAAEALREFEEVVDRFVGRLPESDRAVERTWLLGSAAGAGVIQRLLALELDGQPVVERLVEYAVRGTFEFAGENGLRRVELDGVADRIDLRADGTLQVVDYKTGRAPDANEALQLPIYGACAEVQLAGRHGRHWTVGEAAYVAFGDPRLVVRVGADDPQKMLAEGQRRFVSAIDSIERGEFPPRPIDLFRCAFCAYPTVCRKDYVGEE